MRLPFRIITTQIMMLCVTATAMAADYYYAPQPAETGAAAKEGILVREITVRRKDTLSGLSKQFSGRGYYYPQILLFNKLENPHRIYPGQVLRVPVKHEARRHETVSTNTAVATAAAVITSENVETVKGQQRRRHKTAKTRPHSPAATKQQDAAAVNGSVIPQQPPVQAHKPSQAVVQPRNHQQPGEKKLFEQASAHFRKGDYAEAIRLFDSFISNFPASSLLAEASLNRAECYLRLASK